MLVSNFANRLQEAINYKNLKPAEIVRISEKLFEEGKINKPLNKPIISHYLKGTYEAKQDNVYALSLILNVDEAWLMGYDVPMEKENIRPDFSSLSPKERKIAEGTYNVMHTASVIDTQNNLYKQLFPCPVYGKISAGLPNWAEECLDGYLPIDPNLMNILNPEECYFLRVNGESMNKIVKNGAFALIRKTDFVENGEISVVLVNDNDATLKRFSKEGDIIVLTPESTDSSFKQQIYTKDTPIKVIGKYIGKMEMN